MKSAMSYERLADAASGHARRISAILRAAGLQMSKRVDKWTSTAGYNVHRIGCSRTVAVHWRTGRRWLPGRSEREECEAKMAEAREVLAQKGYTLDERGWWEVKG